MVIRQFLLLPDVVLDGYDVTDGDVVRVGDPADVVSVVDVRRRELRRTPAPDRVA